MSTANLLAGWLVKANEALPVVLRATICDLSSRVLAKGRVGKGYRSIARNGRILLATDVALAELVDRSARVRLQVWHRAILPGDQSEPYGYVLCIRSVLIPPAD